MKMAEEYNPDSYEIILETFKEPLLDKFFANFGFEFSEHREIMQKFDKNFTKLCKINSTYVILGPQKFIEKKIKRLTKIASKLKDENKEKKPLSYNSQKKINKKRQKGTVIKS